MNIIKSVQTNAILLEEKLRAWIHRCNVIHPLHFRSTVGRADWHKHWFTYAVWRRSDNPLFAACVRWSRGHSILSIGLWNLCEVATIIIIDSASNYATSILDQNRPGSRLPSVRICKSHSTNGWNRGVCTRSNYRIMSLPWFPHVCKDVAVCFIRCDSAEQSCWVRRSAKRPGDKTIKGSEKLSFRHIRTHICQKLEMDIWCSRLGAAKTWFGIGVIPLEMHTLQRLTTVSSTHY